MAPTRTMPFLSGALALNAGTAWASPTNSGSLTGFGAASGFGALRVGVGRAHPVPALGAGFAVFGEGLASPFADCGGAFAAGAAFANGALLAFAGAFTGFGGSFLAASRRGAGPALAADLGAGALAAGFGIGFDISDF